MFDLKKQILKAVKACDSVVSVDIGEVISCAGLEHENEPYIYKLVAELIDEHYLFGKVIPADDEIYTIVGLKLTPKGIRAISR